jgi:hypothetical protein
MCNETVIGIEVDGKGQEVVWNGSTWLARYSRRRKPEKLIKPKNDKQQNTASYITQTSLFGFITKRGKSYEEKTQGNISPAPHVPTSKRMTIIHGYPGIKQGGRDAPRKPYI